MVNQSESDITFIYSCYTEHPSALSKEDWIIDWRPRIVEACTDRTISEESRQKGIEASRFYNCLYYGKNNS